MSIADKFLHVFITEDYLLRTYYLWARDWSFFYPNQPLQHLWHHNDHCLDRLAHPPFLIPLLRISPLPNSECFFPDFQGTTPSWLSFCLPSHSLLAFLPSPGHGHSYLTQNNWLWFPGRRELYSGQTTPSVFVLHCLWGPDGSSTSQPHLGIPMERK